MNNLIIKRCVKKPGLIVGARTYRLVLGDEGLYILEIGKAMMETPRTDVVSGAIADVFIDKLAEKREKDIIQVEQSLEGQDLTKLVDNKKNYLVRKEDIKEIELSDKNNELKLSIKATKIKITLYFWLHDKSNLGIIYSNLK